MIAPHPDDPILWRQPYDWIGAYNAWVWGWHCYFYRFFPRLARWQFRRWIAKEW